jgi:hypothetical protein
MIYLCHSMSDECEQASVIFGWQAHCCSIAALDDDNKIIKINLKENKQSLRPCFGGSVQVLSVTTVECNEMMGTAFDWQDQQ